MLFDTWGKLIQYDKGGEDIEGGGLQNFLAPERRALKKLGGGGAPKICILQNQQEGVVGS